jgi:chitobiase/beta-hexosaminidase-like protein/glucodextranase-like protein/Big-like domain-containing protein/LVIVD repeat-containing protein
MIRTPLVALLNRLLWMMSGAAVLLFSASSAFAGMDMTVFGPKRYDRFKGAPNVYADTFERCNPSDLALLRVTNGNGKDTSITAGQISINGTVVVTESDFKQQTYLIERPIMVTQLNELRVELKSSSRETSFVIVEIIGRNCDSTPPIIFASSPGDGALLNIPRPVISASYRDEANGSGINPATARLIVDGVDVTAAALITASGISYTPTTDLSFGDHTANITIADRAANPATLFWHFTTDTIPPMFKITSPLNGQYLNTPLISISGYINDTTARVFANGSEAQVTSQGFMLEGFPLVEELNTITVEAKDPAGNSATDTIKVILDTILPVISITSPADGAFVNTPQIDVSGSIDDGNTTINVNGLAANVAGLNYAVSGFQLQEGDNTITVHAADRATNAVEVTVHVTLDTIAPVIKVETPVADSWVKTPLVTVAGTVADLHPAGLWINGAPVPVIDERFSLENFQLSEGHNVISILALDRAGNETTVDVPINLDTVLPDITISTPTSDLLTRNSKLTVTGTVSEDFTAVTINNLPAQVNGKEWTLVDYSLLEGGNSMIVQATDRALNLGSASVNVTLDTIPPQAPILNSHTSPTNQITVSISGSAEKASTVKVTAAGVLMGTVAADLEGKFILAGVTLVEGTNTFTATATDAAGNESSAASPVSVFQDIMPPVATATPAGGLYRTPQSVSITSSEMCDIYYTTDGTTPTDATTQYSQPISIPASAVLSFFAKDRAGNSSPFRSESYTIDLIPPVVKITSHGNGQYINTPTVTISGTVDDPSAQIAVNGKTAQATDGSFSLSGIGLLEGENNISVEAKDPAGNPGTDSITLNLDMVPPVITVTSPTANAFLNTQQITVTGTVNEPVTAVTVNDAPAVVNGLSFTLSTTLTEGMNLLNIKAFDRAGNAEILIVPVNLDTVPPQLTVSTLSDGAFTNNDTLNISGMVTDVGGLDRLLINDATVTVNGDGSFSHAVVMKNGPNSIAVEAVDKATNKTTNSRIINLDQTAPQLVITAPTDNSKTASQLIEITGNTDEQATVEVKLKDTVQQAALNGNTFTATVIPDYGYNTIEITARDRAGNPSTQKRTVIFDDKKPSLAITEPPQDIRTKNSSLTLRGTAADADGLTVVSVNVAMEGQTLTPAIVDGAFAQPLSFSGEKAYAIIVTATDEVGNGTSVQRNVIYDITPPALTIDPVTTPTNQASQQLSGTREEGATVTVTSATANVGEIVYPTATTWQTIVSDFAEAPNQISVSAGDVAGNAATAATVIVYDITPPTITVTAPVAAAFYKITQISVSGFLSEPVNGVTINTISATVDGQSFALAAVTLSEGLNAVSIKAVDLAGNEGTISLPVNLDTFSPVVTITAPVTGLLTKTAQVSVSGTVSEEFTDISVNGVAATVTGTGFTATQTLAEGLNTLSVQAVDRAGNAGTAAVTVQLDSTPPAAPVLSPLTTPTNVAAVTITGSAEAKAAIKIYRAATLLATVGADDQGGFTLAGVTLADGTNSFTAIATDAAGNEGPASLPVIVILDTNPPQVTISSPANGLLTKEKQVAVSGSVSEELTTVTVNNLPATVSGISWSVSYTLTEGSNILNVQAVDRAGNPCSARVTVTLDSVSPALPNLSSQKTPTNMAPTAISGTAESSSTVKIFATGALIGTVSADGQGNFTLADVTLSEGTNTYTATATDAAGNETLPSAPLTIVLDTKTPVITATAPAEAAFFGVPQISVTGSIDEAVATFTINGQSVTLNSAEFDHPLTLTPGLNSITLVATDLAGNSSTKTILVTLDSTPPVVTITAPLSGVITKTAQVTVSGTISKPNTTATINGTAITVTDQPFSFIYTLAEGDNTLNIEATDRAGNKGNATVGVSLDTQLPILSLQIAAEAAAGANVSIVVNASDNRQLSLVELKADGVPIWSGGSTPSVSESVSYRLSPSLNAGSEVVFQARGIDAAGNEGSATARIGITQAAMGPGYLQGKVLDDGRGLLLADALVTITAVNGGIKSLSTPADGGYFSETQAGSTVVTVTRPGYTKVERLVPVMPEKKAMALDARLTKISDAINLIDTTGGTVRIAVGAGSSRPTVELTIPNGALPAQRDIRLTPVSNQGLAGVLPVGWSPLAAVDIRLLDPVTGTTVDASLAAGATIKIPLPTTIVGQGDPAPTLVLAAYDAASHGWMAKGGATLAAEGTSATADITTAGQYALVIGDPAPNAPAAAEAGAPLAPAAFASPDFAAVSAAGKVVPQASPPSSGLKAAGEVLLTAKAGGDPAPQFTSGLVLNNRITEKFDLKSGDRVEPAAYTQDMVLYRQPCITNIAAGILTNMEAASLRATFPVSPSKEYTLVDLLLGKVAIEIIKPDTADSGVMVGADGGRLVDADGNILAIPQGALSLTTPVATKNGAAATGVVGNDFTLLKVVELNLTRQTLAQSATISIPAPAGLDPVLPLLVARQIDVKGVAKLKLIALASHSGSFITSEPITPQLSNPSTQITSSGLYYFLQAKGQIGFVTGTVTDSGNAPFNGALVKTDKGSLVDLSTATGKYLVAAPIAAVTATATDLYKSDEGSATGTITAANQAVTIDLKILMIPPTVVSVSPTGINIQPNVPVVVTFSKSMDKNSINSQTLTLTDSAGIVVPGVFTFSVDGKTVTFTTADLLKSEKNYTVTIGGGIKDLQVYPIGSDVTSGFTVRKTTPPPMPAAGAISGTFPDADGFITVTGTQGSAEAGSTVLLINDTSGEIQSFKPLSNGSFTGKVRGQLGDEIKVVLMDYSGNQTTISYLTFKNSDGSYLVTAKGGKIEGEGGSILDIPEGALVGPTVIKITTLQESNLPTPLLPPGKYLGAVNIDTGGMPFQKAVEISIPIPAGFNTNDAVFITKPGTLVNSDDTTEQVYEIIDSTKIVGNRITSACDPFPGVWAGGSLVFTDFPDLTPIVVSGYTYQDRNDLPSFQPAPEGVVETPIKDAEGNLVYKYDRPIQGAVIRSPDAWNYVSYTNSKGFYGTFASMAVLPAGFAGPDANCKRYRITAINPQTMFRNTFDGYACAPPYNVRDVNFKLAEKDTIPPDRTAPVISMSLSPVSVSIVAGTTTVGTKLKLPLNIIDQAMKSATLTVNYSELGSGTGSTTSFVLKPPATPVLHAFIKAEQANVFRYDYTAQFNPDAALNYYTPELPGYYTFIVEAHDAATTENVSIRTLQLHVVASGTSLGTPVDGPPRVDAIFPENDSKDIMVTTQIVATFNEPVQNVEGNFKLIDTTTGAAEPAKVITSIEGGRMQATLIPNGNLYYARKYKVVLSAGIKDTAINPSSPNQPPAGDGLFNMGNDFISYFTTKVPNAYDLTTDQQFTGGRDIGLYTFEDTANETDTYAYVAAGDKGWKIVDVTDPTSPGVVFPATSDYKFPAGFNYRSVAVHPDKDKALMGMTENITFADGNQYGYVRFYDLSSEPGDPPVIGREKLAEAYSGIPGRLTMWGDYAVVSTAVAGIQIVNIKQAIENQNDGQPSDGSSIAGVLDTVGQGYGSPNDLAIFNERSAVFTTNPGYLLTVDLNLPTDPTSIADNEPFLPVVINAFKPTGTSFTRIGVATGFPYTDANGMEQTINLAVTASTQGKINTIDLTDPTNPNILNPDTVPIATSVRDITVSKDAGLAFVTTYNAIQVYDIKDPTKPRLLNEITSLPDSSGATNPDGTPVMVPIGETPAIVEKGGWVYLANMTKGMRVLDLDPKIFTLSCNDQIFCNADKDINEVDYYPSLGVRKILLQALDTDKGINFEGATVRSCKIITVTFISHVLCLAHGHFSNCTEV